MFDVDVSTALVAAGSRPITGKTNSGSNKAWQRGRVWVVTRSGKCVVCLHLARPVDGISAVIVGELHDHPAERVVDLNRARERRAGPHNRILAVVARHRDDTVGPVAV